MKQNKQQQKNIQKNDVCFLYYFDERCSLLFGPQLPDIFIWGICMHVSCYYSTHTCLLALRHLLSSNCVHATHMEWIPASDKYILVITVLVPENKKHQTQP